MISVVIPTYNEAGNIKMIAEKVSEQLKEHGPYEIIFIDDGSVDSTLEEIKEASEANGSVKFISLSRNFGHQNALKAGLDNSKGDCVISMDADMQHPPELLGKLIAKWREGFDIVYTIRKETQKTKLTKRITSYMFYKIMNMLSDVEIPFGTADFRLLDRKVVDEFKKIGEANPFMRGLTSWVGFRQAGVEYAAQPRHAGSTKYSMGRMIGFAVLGVTSFSILPLRISLVLGLVISFAAFLYACYALYIRFFTDIAITGWTSLLISVLFLGGIQLLVLGLLGEYLGKMFIEVKARPNYIFNEKNL